MLILLSDLHFVDGSAGNHNLPAAAYLKAFSTINIDLDDPPGSRERLVRKGVREIKIIFLGDIFDAVRSQNWFHRTCGVSARIRPWGTNKSTTPTAQEVKKKFQMILAQMIDPDLLRQAGMDYPRLSTTPTENVRNVWTVCRKLRDFKAAMKGSGLDIEYHYIPGNHDRFMNVDATCRRMAQLALDLDNNGPEGYPKLFTDPEYGLIGFHGHEVDRMNCGHGDLDDRHCDDSLYHEPSIGEAITIEIASRLVYETARRLRSRFPEERSVPKIIRIIENIDNVRPVKAIFPWLEFVARSTTLSKRLFTREVRDIMDNVVEDICDDFAKIKFVRECSERIDQKFIPKSGNILVGLFSAFARVFDIDLHDSIKYINNMKSASALMKMALVSEKTPRERTNELFEHKFNEEILEPVLAAFPDKRRRYYVYGHTHVPEVYPRQGRVFKDRRWRREETVINTGTFRPRIIACGDQQGEEGFTEHKNISFAVVYKKGEISSRTGAEECYEFWNAVLKSE